jgi:predicted ester cyclase
LIAWGFSVFLTIEQIESVAIEREFQYDIQDTAAHSSVSLYFERTFAMAEDNKAKARRLLETLWNKRDLNVADEIISSNSVPHGPFTNESALGPEGSKAFASAFITGFPDVRISVDDQEEDGDLVRNWVTYSGTQRGQLMNIPATGRQATIQALITYRFAGGKIVETWAEWDVDNLMQQLGVG